MKYLLNVTFHAGSDEPSDTDRGLYLITFDNPITSEEIVNVFRKVNKLLDPYEQDEELPISYDDGLNIDTLMEGVALYTKAKVETLNDGYGKIESIDDVYTLEQWQ